MINSTPKTILTNQLYNYVIQHSAKEHQVLQDIREYNDSLPNKRMQIPSEQGQFMSLLTKIIGAKKYLEIGVFTGYSSLSMALGMGVNGVVYAIDSNQEYLNIAKKYWYLAEVADQIVPMLGNASNILNMLCTGGHAGTFDIAFIDANKSEYLTYYEYCYQLVKPRGIILIDNVLMDGEVIHKNPKNYVKSIQQFNQYIRDDIRVDIAILPIADGLTIAYKKDRC